MKYRICYEKTGRLIYVSHLDMQRLFQRLFRRAGVTMLFSQGFNPHALISYAPPLPLFAASQAEYLDIELSGDESPASVSEKLSSACPDGLVIREVRCPEEGEKPLSKLFSKAVYEIVLSTAAGAENVEEWFRNTDEIINEKMTKKKVLKKENIKEKIYSFRAEDVPGGIKLTAELCYLNEGLLNPFTLINSLKAVPGLMEDAKTVSVTKIKVE